MENKINPENESNNKNNHSEQEEMVSESQEEQSGMPGQDAAEVTDTAPESGDNGAFEELQKSQQELAETKDKYLRLYSEFENFRRRTSKEKLDMIQSANEQLIKSLLPVLDDFERAEKNLPQDISKEAEGFLLIHNKLKKVIEQCGAKSMNLEAGSDFDTDTQEAVTQIPAPEEKLKGKVVDVLEKGYTLNDKVIRYAKVVVGN